MKIKILTLLATIGFLLNTVSYAAESPALTESVKSVYSHYLKIQTELAKDSLAGVNKHALAIAKAIKDDDKKLLSLEVARQAETLANAKDLKTVREAFKPLSVSLIKYLADNKVPKGSYYEAYCPMVDASWLQADKNVKNPYAGKGMQNCGEIKN